MEVKKSSLSFGVAFKILPKKRTEAFNKFNKVWIQCQQQLQKQTSTDIVSYMVNKNNLYIQSIPDTAFCLQTPKVLLNMLSPIKSFFRSFKVNSKAYRVIKIDDNLTAEKLQRETKDAQLYGNRHFVEYSKKHFGTKMFEVIDRLKGGSLSDEALQRKNNYLNSFLNKEF